MIQLVMNLLLLLTVVIDSITEEEQATNQTNKRHSRRIIAIKETTFESLNTRRGLSLGKFRIKIYERSQSSTRSTRLSSLHVSKGGKKKVRNTGRNSYNEFWSCDFRRN